MDASHIFILSILSIHVKFLLVCGQSSCYELRGLKNVPKQQEVDVIATNADSARPPGAAYGTPQISCFLRQELRE
jgi:hypothetical protein